MTARNIHRPLHLYLNSQYCFISARTVNKNRYFYGNRKDILVKILNECLRKYNYSCYAWVILDNHYHILIRIKEHAEQLKSFIRELHAQSSKAINKLDNHKGRQVWYQYWDRYIRSQEDFWFRFNYIHHNPVKHGYVKNQKEVLNYRFCSFKQWIDKKGYNWVDSLFNYYPIYPSSIEGVA